MNTPAHAVASLLVLGRQDRPGTTGPILAGALLPDLPMFAFYGVEKLRGVPERVIWSQSYYHEAWQGFFDAFNSIPLILAGLLVARLAAATRWQAFFASMAVHVAGDLPLHHDDGHRHFYPFSDWRFESPVSYWDPAHYGGVAALFEALLVVAGSVVLYRRFDRPAVRGLVAVLGGVYVLYWIYVVVVWV